MKNILFIIFFALFLPKVAFSKSYHDQIFGIKILDDVNNYIEECDIDGTYLKTENCISLLKTELEIKPKEQEFISAQLPYSRRKARKDETYKYPDIVLKWTKNPMFENYNLIMDKNFKISSISAGIEVSDQDINEFKNLCRPKKIDLVKRISEIYDIPKKFFFEYDYKNNYPNREDYGPISVEGSELKYYVKNEPVILRVICSYTIHDNSTKVRSYFLYQLSTSKYWNYAIDRANKSGRIKREIKNLTDEEIIRNDTGL